MNWNTHYTESASSIYILNQRPWFIYLISVLDLRPQCVSLMCIFNVRPECAALICVLNVCLQCASLMYVRNVRHWFASWMCALNMRPSHVNHGVISRNWSTSNFFKISQNCFEEIMQNYVVILQIWSLDYYVGNLN